MRVPQRPFVTYSRRLGIPDCLPRQMREDSGGGDGRVPDYRHRYLLRVLCNTFVKRKGPINGPFCFSHFCREFR